MPLMNIANAALGSTVPVNTSYLAYQDVTLDANGDSPLNVAYVGFKSADGWWPGGGQSGGGGGLIVKLGGDTDPLASYFNVTNGPPFETVRIYFQVSLGNN